MNNLDKVQPGMYLYASCSAKIYGQIKDVYQAENDKIITVADVLIYNLDDILNGLEDEEYENKYIFYDFDLSNHQEPILVKNIPIEYINGDGSDVGYKVTDDKRGNFYCTGYTISLATPGDGCSKCTKYFFLCLEGKIK
jgi:hypothetical protein